MSSFPFQAGSSCTDKHPLLFLLRLPCCLCVSRVHTWHGAKPVLDLVFQLSGVLNVGHGVCIQHQILHLESILSFGLVGLYHDKFHAEDKLNREKKGHITGLSDPLPFLCPGRFHLKNLLKAFAMAGFVGWDWRSSGSWTSPSPPSPAFSPSEASITDLSSPNPAHRDYEMHGGHQVTLRLSLLPWCFKAFSELFLFFVNSRTKEDKRLNYLNYASATELGFSSLGMAKPGEVLPFVCFLNVTNSWSGSQERSSVCLENR